MKKLEFFIFLLLFYFLTISFHSNIEHKDTIPTLSDTSQFFAEIDGKEISFIDGTGRVRNGSNIFKNIKKVPDTSNAIFQSYFYKYPAGQADISINIGTIHFVGNKIKNVDFINFIKNGFYTFSLLAENGVEISYIDKKLTKWSTSQGNQDQSTFEITELRNDSINLKFKAVFNCTLYNSEGNSKKLEKGTFIGYFRNK